MKTSDAQFAFSPFERRHARAVPRFHQGDFRAICVCWESRQNGGAQGESVMAKGQQKSNKEKRKPKKEKAPKK